MRQSPINPSDINTVEGKYPLAPKLPGGVPGHEGVGRVTHVGSEVLVYSYCVGSKGNGVKLLCRLFAKARIFALAFMGVSSI